jgi:hypothetical protein
MKSNTLIKGQGIGLDLQGRYRLQVVDAVTREIVSDYGWHKNLILNTGMDAVASQYLASLNAAGACGTGSRPNYITASTTITQSGYYVSIQTPGDMATFTHSVVNVGSVYHYTASGVFVPTNVATMSYTSSINKGDILVDENLSMSMVVSVTGSFLTVDTPYTYSTPVSFSVWKTSQAKLQNEQHRSSTYYVSNIGWNTGTTSVPGISGSFTHRRTYDMPVESQTMSYTEIGVSWSGTSNADLFSRAVLPSTVVVSPLQLLRLTHDVMVNYTPTASVYGVANISGWPEAPATNTNFTESIQAPAFSIVDAGGGVGTSASYFVSLDVPYGGGSFGSNGFQCFLSADTQPIQPFGSSVDRSYFVTAQGGSLDGYTNLSFTRTKSVTFAITAWTSSVNFIRTIGFGSYLNNGIFGIFAQPYWAGHNAYCMQFEQSQSKLNTETLTLSWRWRWARILQ